MNPLDAIALTIPGLEVVEERDGVRVWCTPDGDFVGLYYFAIARIYQATWTLSPVSNWRCLSSSPPPVPP